MFIKTQVSNNPPSSEITPDSVFKIKGSLQKQGVPVVGIVQLLSVTSGRVIQVSRSKPDGFYEFKGLPKRKYIIFSRDDHKQYNAVIQDNVVPK